MSTPRGTPPDTPPNTPMSTPAPVDFYFDFISGYGYFASLQIEALAARHGRKVNWLLG